MKNVMSFGEWKALMGQTCAEWLERKGYQFCRSGSDGIDVKLGADISKEIHLRTGYEPVLSIDLYNLWIIGSRQGWRELIDEFKAQYPSLKLLVEKEDDDLGLTFSGDIPLRADIPYQQALVEALESVFSMVERMRALEDPDYRQMRQRALRWLGTQGYKCTFYSGRYLNLGSRSVDMDLYLTAKNQINVVMCLNDVERIEHLLPRLKERCSRLRISTDCDEISIEGAVQLSDNVSLKNALGYMLKPLLDMLHEAELIERGEPLGQDEADARALMGQCIECLSEEGYAYEVLRDNLIAVRSAEGDLVEIELGDRVVLELGVECLELIGPLTPQKMQDQYGWSESDSECLKLNVGHGCQSIISCYSVVPQDGEGGLQDALAQRLRAAFKLLRIARDQKQ